MPYQGSLVSQLFQLPATLPIAIANTLPLIHTSTSARLQQWKDLSSCRLHQAHEPCEPSTILRACYG
jgi:hypothetical protein